MPDPGQPSPEQVRLVELLTRLRDVQEILEAAGGAALVGGHPHQKIKRLRHQVNVLLDENPELVSIAEDVWDFNYQPKEQRQEEAPGEGKPDTVPEPVVDLKKDKGKDDLKHDNIDHLPGKVGKDYHFVKGPSGVVHVVFSMDIPGPKKGSISFSVPPKLFDRYGVDPDKVKTLTKAQIKNLKGFGPINEVKLKRGEHPFQSWLRQMRQKFGMAPSMLRDKEVMQVLYAAHLGQWDQAQLLGSLQQTKWYDTKTKERIDWLFKLGSADKKTRIASTTNGLTDYVRQAFGGVDWTEHGITQKKLKDWATNISSGKTGWDLSEAKSRIDEIARGIEGTTLWAEEERAAQAGLEEAQEWEDIFEQYRAKNIQWLGPNGRSSREVLTDWAKKRASGEVSDGDYQQFLRQQRTDIYPYITGDRSWQEFADPYKSALQRVMGDNASIDWNHVLLSDLGAKDNNGSPTGTAMSLYDFNLLARDPDKNPAAYNQGTALYDQGADRLAQILAQLRGVAA